MEKTFYVSLAPRRDDKGTVSGVIGLAWDVTPNQVILESLQKIADMPGDASVSLAKKEAQKAISASRLHKLLSNLGD